ncbi:MAG: amidohydrolase/deacetylase family metallohydrolase [Candidatus Bathyarchaeia archaeon]
MMYDLVVKGGHVIDPSQGIDEPMDVAVSNGKVHEVRRSISTAGSKHVIDASGLFVAPGFIDIHVHCCHYIAYIGIDPESVCLANGSTTVLDVGSTGELNFMGFRKYVIERCKTRIFALLNIESLGMIEFAREEQEWPKLIMEYEEMFINVKDTLKTIKENSDVILGIKWAHHTPKGLKLARKAADEAKCVLMAENHFQPETLKYMRKGDVVTHIFHRYQKAVELRPSDGLLDEDGNVQPEFYDAIKRGVIMDVGHGYGSFVWEVAEKAFEQGIRPDTISTDLHVMNVNGPVYDLPTTMSKFLLLGMPLYDVIRASTTKPAEVIGKENEVGTLKPGASADLAIFKLEEGRFAFVDVNGNKKIGRQRLRVTNVVRGGEVIKKTP